MHALGTDEYIRYVVSQYSQTLLRLAYTRLGSTADAEDAVQEVFLKLLTREHPFRDQEHEKAWLIRTTLNRASDLRRAAERRCVSLDEALTVGREETPAILSAVRELPEKYSAVIHLYYYEGYSMKEIAKLLSLPVPTVGTRLARGRERLKQILKEDVI